MLTENWERNCVQFFLNLDIDIKKKPWQHSEVSGIVFWWERKTLQTQILATDQKQSIHSTLHHAVKRDFYALQCYHYNQNNENHFWTGIRSNFYSASLSSVNFTWMKSYLNLGKVTIYDFKAIIWQVLGSMQKWAF